MKIDFSKLSTEEISQIVQQGNQEIQKRGVGKKYDQVRKLVNQIKSIEGQIDCFQRKAFASKVSFEVCCTVSYDMITDLMDILITSEGDIDSIMQQIFDFSFEVHTQNITDPAIRKEISDEMESVLGQLRPSGVKAFSPEAYDYVLDIAKKASAVYKTIEKHDLLDAVAEMVNNESLSEE